MAELSKDPPPYRWVIEALLVFALIGQALTWLAPAPILGPIVKDLNVGLGSGGLIISIIALCISIFSLLGAVVSERLGALRALLVGVWLLSIGAILSGFTSSFAALLACRVMEGIGFGIMIAPPGTLVVQWFAENEWAYINMVNAVCPYIGLTTVFALTAPIYFALGSSWRAVLRDYGLVVAAIALAWTVLGREREGRAADAAVAAGASEGGSVLLEVIKMREVALLAFALFGGMWVFQLYTAYLPTFFTSYRGFSLGESANLTSVLPLTGIFAALGGGIGTSVIGLRRPFMWPLGLVALLGCLGAMTMPSTGAIRLSLVLVGIGSAGGLAAALTTLMELPGMTPAKVGAGLGFIWSVGYAGAFVSPFLGGAIAGALGLRTVMLAFLLFQFMPIVGMFLIPETGKGRVSVQPAQAVSH